LHLTGAAQLYLMRGNVLLPCVAALLYLTYQR
jgi:hypothetical protein